jgi:hypothetical protein
VIAHRSFGWAAVLSIGLVFGVTVSAAADGWKKHSGHGRHAPDYYYMGDHGRYEWRAGECKYKYKSDKHGYREEAKCKRGPYIALLPPARFVPHDHRHDDSAPQQYTLGPQVAAPETGRYCREYQRTVTVGGQAQAAYGRACWRPDGSWEIMD